METLKIANYGAYGLHIIKFPSGKFGFVGSVPEILLNERRNKLGLPYKVSKLFDTLSDANKYFEDNKHLIS